MKQYKTVLLKEKARPVDAEAVQDEIERYVGQGWQLFQIATGGGQGWWMGLMWVYLVFEKS